MGYREAVAPGELAGLAECAWSAGVPRGGREVVHDVLPDGCMDLLWTGTELVVAGPDTAPHPYLRSPGLVASGLRFAPGRLPALLGLPAAELRDTRVPLAELHPRLARRAGALLADAAGRAAVTADDPRPDTPVIAALARVARALPGADPEPAVAVLAARLARPDTASVAALADSLGWTPRTLHRHCLAAFGYGPAVLRRILRFRRATDLLAAGVQPADAAARAGYADQPHLSREVRTLGGFSPAAIVRSAAG